MDSGSGPGGPAGYRYCAFRRFRAWLAASGYYVRLSVAVAPDPGDRSTSRTNATAGEGNPLSL